MGALMPGCLADHEPAEPSRRSLLRDATRARKDPLARLSPLRRWALDLPQPTCCRPRRLAARLEWRPCVAGSAPLTGLSLAVALAALTGCGGSSSGTGVASKSPAEIVAAARAAADGASAVHVSGSTVTGGTPLTFDLSLAAGKGGRGRIAENGLSFELIELEGTIYIKGSSAFYKHFAGAAAAQLLQGKWLKAPATNASFAGPLLADRTAQAARRGAWLAATTDYVGVDRHPHREAGRPSWA